MTLDKAAGNRVIDFFERYLVHIDGEWAGTPFRPADWQKDYLRLVFGTKNADGLRQYRKSLMEVPIGQGKSTFAAGIALYMLLADNEPGSQVFLAAANRDQARVIFRVASEMVQRNDELREACDVLDSTRRILYRKAAAFLAVLPGEARTAYGINAHAIIFDELHTQKDRRLYDVLSFRMRSRRQPLFLMLTTAGVGSESVWAVEHDYAEKVKSGVIEDPTYLPVLYGASAKDDWRDPATWKKANPSWDALGETFQRGIAADAKRAQDDPASLNNFLRQRLNIPTATDIRAIPMDAWDASAGYGMSLEELRGRRCHIGLDMANTEDIAAEVLVFPPEDRENGVYDVLCRFWIPEDSVPKRVRQARVPYADWVSDGLLRTTHGNVIDYAAIEKQILADVQTYEVESLRFDPWNAGELASRMNEEVRDDFSVRIDQNFRMMSAPTKELLRLVAARRLRHGGNKVLRWMADNLTVEEDAEGKIRPAKKKSREKIDGLVALILGLDGAMREESSYMEGDGVLKVI